MDENEDILTCLSQKTTFHFFHSADFISDGIYTCRAYLPTFHEKDLHTCVSKEFPVNSLVYHRGSGLQRPILCQTSHFPINTRKITCKSSNIDMPLGQQELDKTMGF